MLSLIKGDRIEPNSKLFVIKTLSGFAPTKVAAHLLSQKNGQREHNEMIGAAIFKQLLILARFEKSQNVNAEKIIT